MSEIDLTCAACMASITSTSIAEVLAWEKAHDKFCDGEESETTNAD